MKNYKRRFIFLGMFVAFIAALTAFVYFKPGYLNLSPEQNDQEQLIYTSLLKQSSEIQRVWIEGEESNEWIRTKESCLKVNQVTNAFDETLLRCNPMVILCANKFLKNKKFNLLDNKLTYINKANSDVLGIEEGGFIFTLVEEKSKSTLNVLLKELCHETYLDQRVYTYGEMNSLNNKYKFDNFNQNIYLDKHLVTNFEINTWIEFGKNQLNSELSISKGNELFLPAYNLTLEQMNGYCQFKGKELMQAQWFDAATFLPMDLEDKLQKNNFRSSYFWTKKNNESVNRCDYVFGKECLEKNNYRLNFVSPTWAGLNDSMGGIFEAFKNPIEPEKNLKISSYYLPMNSKWQKLGKRTHWDGIGFNLRNFDFNEVDLDKSINKFKVGFRCMRKSN